VKLNDAKVSAAFDAKLAVYIKYADSMFHAQAFEDMLVTTVFVVTGQRHGWRNTGEADWILRQLRDDGLRKLVDKPKRLGIRIPAGMRQRLSDGIKARNFLAHHSFVEHVGITFAPTPQERDRALRDLSLRDDAIAKADATLQPLYLSVMKRLGVDVPKAASTLLQQTTKDFIEPE